MNFVITTLLLIEILAFGNATKNLVIVGGNLEDDNEQIYGRIIDLAVGLC